MAVILKTGGRPQNNDRIGGLISAHRPGSTLPGEFYRDASIFDLDLAAIFMRHWLFAGHTSQIPRPGDYVTYQVGVEPIIILRGEDEEVRALFNTFRHRGSLVCTGPAGHTKRLICPYHQWVYALDGTLVAAQHMPEDFDRSKFGLGKAHCKVIEGLIFICLAEEPPDLRRVESDIVPRLQPHGLRRAKICQTRVYEVRANWKLINENARECQHCPGSHPEYCAVVTSAAAVNSVSMAAQSRAITEERLAHWKRLGLETAPQPFRPGGLHAVARYAFNPGVVTQSLDGQPVAPLMGSFTERDMGVLGIGIYPNFLCEASSDHSVTLRFTPLGPSLTRVEMNWLVHENAQEGVDYEVERVEAVWRATAEQDWKLCEANQAGVESSRYRPGPYSALEEGCDHFVRWYLHELKLKGGPLPACGARAETVLAEHKGQDMEMSND